MRWLSSTTVAVGLAATVMAAWAPQALGHASFLQSTPRPGARLASAPSRIVLTYTEPLNRRLTSLRLVDAGTDERVPVALRVVSGRRLVATPQRALPQGAYRLDWRSVSTIDGHIREGSVSFGVGTDPQGAAASLERSPLAGAGPLRAALRAAFYAALLLFAAGLLIPALLGGRFARGRWLAPGRPGWTRASGWPADARPGDGTDAPGWTGASVPGRPGWSAGRPGAGSAPPARARSPVVERATAVATKEATGPAGAVEGEADRIAARAWRRTVRAGWLAAGLAIVVVAVETLDAAGGLAPDDMRDFLLGGLGGFSRLMLIAAALTAAATAARWPGAATALVALALLAVPLGGHAGSVDEARVPALLTDWVHLGAAAVWIGGIAHVAWACLPGLRRAGWGPRRRILADVLPRFGRLALWAFLVVATTGLTNALIQLGHPQELWQSAYGRILALKIALVAAIAAISYAHAFRLRPALLRTRPGAQPAPGLERRHRRLLASEPGVGIAVLTVAAVLVAFPVPPREVGDSFGSLRACDPCPFAVPAPDELSVADRVGRLTAAVWLRRDGDGLTGTLRLIDGKRKPARRPTRIVGASEQTSCGPGCWRFRHPRSAALTVRVREGAATSSVRLPARWARDGDARARRLLAAVQREMRSLRSFHQTEWVASARQPKRRARADLRFRAPDRMGYETSAGSENIVIDRRSWLRAPGMPGWQDGPQVEPFRVRDGFRWTIFDRSVRLIATREERSRRVAELALLDHGYPVWYRLTVDLRSRRALRGVLVTPENLIEDRYFAFDRRVRIEAP